MIVSWRYWLSVRPAIVALLFLLHSFMLYKCVLDGRSENDADVSNAKSQFVTAIGPVYSLRVHLVNDLLNSGTVGQADALILSFTDDRDHSEAIRHFKEKEKWQIVLPLRTRENVHLEPMHKLPERRFPFADKVPPVPAVVYVRDALAWFRKNSLIKDTLSSNDIAAVFLFEEDPANVQVPWGGTLKDELNNFTNSGRIPQMAEHWGITYGARWAFFISPCQSNQMISLGVHHLKFFRQPKLPWICVASDSLIEVNAESRLLNVVYDNM